MPLPLCCNYRTAGFMRNVTKSVKTSRVSVRYIAGGSVPRPYKRKRETVTGEFGKNTINFAKRFAISVYAWYTVWALIDIV